MRYNTDMSETTLPPTTQSEASETSTASPTAPAAAAHIRKKPAKGRVFRRIGYTRAIIEGVLLFAAFRLLEMVPINVWPGATVIGILFLLLILHFCPPVWAAMRVVSTKREKMSRRFWKMGPILAGLCLLVDMAAALGLGQASFPSGPDGNGPALLRFLPGAAHSLSVGSFLVGELGTAAFLFVYFTIAVICTRLANGGFLRFTMPSGNGRVTL
jgi:hypothetical protein